MEEHQNWETIATIPSFLEKQKKVCSAVGACEEEMFEFQDTPLMTSQEQWNASCYVCQAFARDLEERIHLSRFLTEKTIVPLVAQTCDRLVRFPSTYFYSYLNVLF
jgi:regulator of sigma D